MEMKELATIAPEELGRLLAKKREELRALRFRLAAAEEKDVRAVRETRKDIARIQTTMRQKRPAPTRT